MSPTNASTRSDAPEAVAYVNARLVDPGSGLDAPGALYTRGGLIADVGARLFADGVPDGLVTVDCGGKVLAPGLIDIRVNLCEPGGEHKESIATASAAAAAGGVTSVVALPNTDPPIDNEALIEFIARRAREVRGVRVYSYAAVTRGTAGKDLTELGILAEAGAVGFTDGNRAVADARVMRRALNYAATFGLLIIQHPEEPSLARDGQMNDGELATRLGLAGIPQVAELLMIERDLRLVEATGARLHIAHVSTAGGIAAIRAARARGVAVTCDTAPAYFYLNETAVGEYRTFAKVSPPLRDESDRAAVAEAVADGTVDVVASDHSPHDQDSKRQPFAQADAGIVGLETLLPLTLALHHGGRMTLIEALRRLTARPAEILGLPGGRLRPGAPADLVLFDPDAPWRIDTERFLSKSKNAPYDGHPVQGRVIRTMVAGRTLFAAGSAQ